MVGPATTAVGGGNADTTTARGDEQEGDTAMHVDGVSIPVHDTPASATTSTTDEITTTAEQEQQLAEADRRRAGLAQVCTQFLAHLTRDHQVVEQFQANRGTKRLLTTVSRFDGRS